VAKKQPDFNVDLTSPFSSVSLDADNFDAFIRSQGVQLVHFRGVKCPVGLSDRYDIRHTHSDRALCSNGYLYTEAGCVTGAFTSNSNKMDQADNGLLDAANVTVTLPHTYDDSDEIVDVMPFDRFYLKQEEILIPHVQIVQSHESGHDRLDYLCVKVIDLIDSDGHYHHLGEFELDDGQIVWKNGGLPYNVEEQKGAVYTIRFLYRPYWYVTRLMHQIRVAQVQTEEGRVVRRFPQQIALQREYIFQNVSKDSVDPDNPRTVEGPGNDGFGPR
jgi:hypothetical protein